MSRRMVAILLAAVVSLGACGSGAAVRGAGVERVLIVSLPGVTWGDVADGSLPALAALSETAAIGDLSTRIGRRGASTTDAYLSIGAGTRAVAPRVDVAVALDPDETYGGVRTADILRRRLGRVPVGVAYLPVGAAIDRNERSAFGAVPGRLGDLLADAGVRRAVIANADAAEGFVSDEPTPDGAYARGAAAALMGSDGIVPSGTVGRGLLLDDPLAPFGRRLDHDAVLAAFDRVWEGPGRGVVLVEASDLSRAAGYRARATPDQAEALRLGALTSSDALLEALLARTDPARDAVLVVSPVAPSGAPELAVAALRTPSVDAGVLRSATTRRDGYVQLADVAPTVLSLLGVEPPSEIEGREFRVQSRPAAGRVGDLTRAAAAAGFRDDLMPIVVPLVIGFLVVLAAATLLVVRARSQLGGARSTAGFDRAIVPLALGALGVVPATFVAAQWTAVVGRTAGYLAVVAVLAAAFGAAAWAVERRWPGGGTLAGVGAIVAMFALDLVVGAPLQVNAVFGYSLAVAGRFAGLGNLAFALFGASTVVLATLLVDRFGRRGLAWAIGLMSVVVLLEGLPMLGADVGGVLSMVPAFGAAALVLSGRPLTALRVAGLALAAGGAVFAFALVDVLRPSGSQTHLARIADHLFNGRWEPVSDSLTRRLDASFGDAELAVWALVVGLGVSVGLYVALVLSGRVDPTRILGRGDPTTTAAAVGLGVLATVGLVANDSSIAVPTTMLIVVAPVAMIRAIAPPPGDRRVDMGPT